ADRLLDQFGQFFGDNSSLKYKTFVLKYDGNDDKFNALKSWLDDQGIQYGRANSKSLKGYDYTTGRSSDFSVNSEDLVISMKQPKATLAHILFEPKTKLVDSVTYDITAWGVPYAYGIQAFATTQAIEVSSVKKVEFVEQAAPEKTYAFVNKWESINDARFLAALLKANVKVRFSQKPFSYRGKSFDRGSLIIAKRDNKRIKDFESVVVQIANTHERTLSHIQTGFMDGGPDIGSSDVRYIKKPRIALLGHEGTSSLAFGATWHFLEQELKYSFTVIGTDYFNRVNLSEYDVLLMPSGRYENFGEKEMERIADWISAGGKLIAVERALNKLKDSEYSALSRYVDDAAKSDAEEQMKKRKKVARMVSYDDQERAFIKGFAPGAIYKVKMDKSHPLAFG
ncbi:MAG: zinc carboxypeptidase, partial [Bacteroidota bacterium]